MSDDETPRSGPAAVNPVKPVVLVLFLAMLGIEAVFSLGAAGYVGGPEAVGWRLGAIQKYAFSGTIFDAMLQEWRWPLEQVMRTFTYPFVHASLTHTVIAAVIFVALGKMVGDAYGSVAAVVLFVVPAALGAIAFAVLTDSGLPILGAFPVIYAYVGAYTYVNWVRLGARGEPRYKAFSLIAVLLALQLIFGVAYQSGPIWVSEVVAFCVGLALAPLLAPGGWRRFVASVRRD